MISVLEYNWNMQDLRNTNRGRDIDKRPFNKKTMGGKYSLLDTPDDVDSDYNTKKII